MAASTSTIAQRSGQTLSVWISQLPIVRFKKCAGDGPQTSKDHNFEDVWVLEGKREGPYYKKTSLKKTIRKKHLVKMKMVLTNVPPLIITSPPFFQLLVLNFSPCWICPMHLPVLPSAALVGAFKLPPYPKWTDVHGGCPVLPDDRNSWSGAPRKTKGKWWSVSVVSLERRQVGGTEISTFVGRNPSCYLATHFCEEQKWRVLWQFLKAN